MPRKPRTLKCKNPWAVFGEVPAGHWRLLKFGDGFLFLADHYRSALWPELFQPGAKLCEAAMAIRDAMAYRHGATPDEMTTRLSGRSESSNLTNKETKV